VSTTSESVARPATLGLGPDGALSQTISSDGTIRRTGAQVTWQPSGPFTPDARKGLATACLAYDDNRIYFAAFRGDWTEHWANDVEFGFARQHEPRAAMRLPLVPLIPHH